MSDASPENRELEYQRNAEFERAVPYECLAALGGAAAGFVIAAYPERNGIFHIGENHSDLAAADKLDADTAQLKQTDNFLATKNVPRTDAARVILGHKITLDETQAHTLRATAPPVTGGNQAEFVALGFSTIAIGIIGGAIVGHSIRRAIFNRRHPLEKYTVAPA